MAAWLATSAGVWAAQGGPLDTGAEPPPMQFARADGRPEVVLLGEVHDNAAQHAMRLQAFKDLLATGARPALLMEQLDRDRQGDIDRARAGSTLPDADGLIAAAAGSKQWNWAFYRPFIELAIANDLPVLAANVSRQDAQRVMSNGLADTGFDADVPPDILLAHAKQIENSHCGLVDNVVARRMASAQVARDQFMARLVEAHAARGVVLLAGNGHVQTGTGVPRWLSPPTRARSMAVGFVEEGDESNSRYDRVVTTPRQPREDPCVGMRRFAPAVQKA